MRLLDAVERSIDELESRGRRVRVFRESLTVLTMIIVAYPHSWTAGVKPGSIVPQVQLDHLETLGELIESNLVVADPSQLALLQEVVNDARDLLVEDDSIDPKLRQYLVELVRELQNALTDSTVEGAFDFRKAAERLWVAMQGAGGSSTKKASSWRAKAEKLIPPVVTGVATHLGGIGIDAAVAALTTG